MKIVNLGCKFAIALFKDKNENHLDLTENQKHSLFKHVDGLCEITDSGAYCGDILVKLYSSIRKIEMIDYKNGIFTSKILREKDPDGYYGQHNKNEPFIVNKIKNITHVYDNNTWIKCSIVENNTAIKLYVIL